MPSDSLDPLVALAAATYVGGVLYGVHVVLFAQCFYILIKRRDKRYQAQILLVVLLFALATITVIINGAALKVTGSSFLLPGNHSRNMSTFTKSIVRTSILFLANFIGDIMLLWRCYVVWGGMRWPVILSGSMCLINHVMVLIVIFRYRGGWQFVNNTIDLNGTSLSANYITCGLYFGTAFTNALITSLIAGRIFYISRRTSAILGSKMYRLVFTITIESGMIYPIALIVFAAISVQQITNIIVGYNDLPALYNPIFTVFGTVLQDTLISVLGISQTLIVVRIALGLACSSMEEMIWTISNRTRSSGVVDVSQTDRSV